VAASGASCGLRTALNAHPPTALPRQRPPNSLIMPPVSTRLARTDATRLRLLNRFQRRQHVLHGQGPREPMFAAISFQRHFPHASGESDQGSGTNRPSPPSAYPFPIRCQLPPHKYCLTFSASDCVNPTVAAISSTGASLTPESDPNLRSNARLRFGPTPGTESSALSIPDFDRTLRW
jgi:hypothetical protein